MTATGAGKKSRKFLPGSEGPDNRVSEAAFELDRAAGGDPGSLATTQFGTERRPWHVAFRHQTGGRHRRFRGTEITGEDNESRLRIASPFGRREKQRGGGHFVTGPNHREANGRLIQSSRELITPVSDRLYPLVLSPRQAQGAGKRQPIDGKRSESRL